MSIEPSLRAAESSPVQVAVVTGFQGLPMLLRTGRQAVVPVCTNQPLYLGDLLITTNHCRVWLRFSDRTAKEVGHVSVYQVVPAEPGPEPGFWHYLRRGVVHLFKRDPPGSYNIKTPAILAGVKGTEFVLEVDEDGTTRLSLLDGEVVVEADGFDPVTLAGSGEIVARPGEAPRPVLDPDLPGAIRWALYYPGVLHLGDLGLTPAQARSRGRPSAQTVAGTADTSTRLSESLTAYQAGDLVTALVLCPEEPALTSDSERLYRAAVLLATGEVRGAERLLREVEAAEAPGSDLAAVANALRQVIDAVVQRPRPPGRLPQTATEWLARSYQLQFVEANLAGGRDAALAAVAAAPDFAFGWSRLAELQFSHGDLRATRVALDRSLALAERNAQAWAVKGFVLAGQNRIRQAIEAFETAIACDNALGNAWLGRGLCRIRQGDLKQGTLDLQAAVAREPQRAVLRSYLAKAYNQLNHDRIAFQEIGRARDLDPADPTAWLFSALIGQQHNRINQAVRDLEHSVDLNTNRYVYRSKLLLDQDRSMRGVNLANIYADAGLSDVSVREATRAVNSDYANASAHLFLANSYNALRDPRQVNLRYEAPWYTEFLLANLLAPVGAGTLSQTVSQNEYSKLFQRDGLGVVSETLWTSNGDWLQSGAQFGQFGNFEYALDALYRSEVGQRPNNDLDQLTLALSGKAQLGAADTLLLHGSYYHAESGDAAQYYDPAMASSDVRFHERHEPILLAGWHHEWRPGVHTLFLVSPWNVHGSFEDPSNWPWQGDLEADGSITPSPTNNVQLVPLDYDTRFTGVSAELQQLWSLKAHTLIGGVRYQKGEFNTDAIMDVWQYYGAVGQPVLRNYGASPEMQRLSVYAYDQWQVLPWALVTVGLAYDRLDEPVNLTRPPLTDAEDSLEQVSPKLGLTLSPWKGGTLRGAYARSLGGVSFDQSYRLEPSQVAGFTQTYRGLMPESLVGLVPGQDMETWGVACEQHLPTRTYLAVSAHQSNSDASHGFGAFLWDPAARQYVTETLTESLEFRERTLSATAHQLIGDYVSLAAGYRLSEARLETDLVNVNGSAGTQRSVLHQVLLSARFNHPCGAFARWDSVWTQQSNYDDVSALDGDELWRHDLWAGWRFWQRRAELAVGVLNLTDQDYRLYPLNHYPEAYRERTFAVSGRFNF